MEWTKDPPEMVGWYFVRSARDPGDWSIKLVYRHFQDGSLLVTLGMERSVTLYPMFEWLGPIAPSMVVGRD